MVLRAQELAQYTREGLRVLGLATRDLGAMSERDAMRASQEQLERGLCFLGFAVMVNRLKPDTADVIRHLQAADLRCAMITGDHVVTGVSIGRQCGILDPGKPCAVLDRAHGQGDGAPPSLEYRLLWPDGSQSPQYGDMAPTVIRHVEAGEWECAVTGKGFAALQALAGSAAPDPGQEEEEEEAGTARLLGGPHQRDLEAGAAAARPGMPGSSYPALRRLVLERCGVFARMNPDGKKQVVDWMGPGPAPEDPSSAHGLGHNVGFCGDGANDLAVLKAALVGVSLCDADASVAAPLTSKNQSVSCVIDVVAEGRCSLITAYNIFQFIMLYAFVQVPRGSRSGLWSSGTGKHNPGPPFAAGLCCQPDVRPRAQGWKLPVPDPGPAVLDRPCDRDEPHAAAGKGLRISCPARWGEAGTRPAAVCSLLTQEVRRMQDSLGRARPAGRLTSWAIMLPVLLQFAVAGVFQAGYYSRGGAAAGVAWPNPLRPPLLLLQVLGLVLLRREPWYHPFRPGQGGVAPLAVSRSVENTVVFLVSLAQLTIGAVVFQKARAAAIARRAALPAGPCWGGTSACD